MKTMLLTVAAFLLLPVSGLCWSAPGHQAIAEAAMQMLHGTSAEAKIKSILKTEAPQDAAIWLDLVRENKINNREAKKFRKAFSSSPEWHFCNFIVGSTNFTFASKYATTNDVVPALERAIAVLEGAPSAMTKRQALRSVIHLVGDIHQPLHCITGFYDVTDLAKPVSLDDVADPLHATQDRGGNQLMYTSSENLHHFWDLVLPDGISTDVGTLASKIAAPSLAGEPLTQGDFHHWPEIWAGHSMQMANAAYNNITYKSAEFVTDPQHPGGKKRLEIHITLPQGEAGYKMNQQATAEAQLKLAAVHLAQLLSKIDFK